MIIFIIGTSADLIKIYPIYNLIEKRESKFIISLDQQRSDVNMMARDLNIRFDHRFEGAPDVGIRNKKEMFIWILRIIPYLFGLKKILKNKLKLNRDLKSIILVHGDTITASVASSFFWLNRFKIGHIEAGLRSNKLFDPFPEELNRRIISKFSSINYIPDDLALENLKYSKGLNILTNGNTILDALKLIREKAVSPMKTKTTKEPTVLISLHRNEFLSNKQVFIETWKEILYLSIDVKFKLILDNITKNEMVRINLFDQIKSSSIEVLEKMPYSSFISILKETTKIITDSGGLQEEAAYLGIPTLIHRRNTERFDGIGSNIELSNWDVSEISRFVLESGNKVISKVNNIKTQTLEPSKVVYNHLSSLGFIPK